MADFKVCAVCRDGDNMDERDQMDQILSYRWIGVTSDSAERWVKLYICNEYAGVSGSINQFRARIAY